MGLRWSLFPSTFSRELPGHPANNEEEPTIAELMRKGRGQADPVRARHAQIALTIACMSTHRCRVNLSVLTKFVSRRLYNCLDRKP
jgi:hypothetical protein